MKAAFIATYPPRQCGIATFTSNLVKGIIGDEYHSNIQAKANIVAINKPGANHQYPEEVKFVINESNQPDYLQAARFINFSDAQVCVLQHEFGIFGGDDGIYILPLLHRLKIPLIAVFHTVLDQPSFLQQVIVETICQTASRVVVMSRRAIQFLTSIYKIPSEKITLIEHGIPDFDRIDLSAIKPKMQTTSTKTILTFGLLSRNKGIETIIHALPRLIVNHPDIQLIVLGKTHPAVLKSNGEEYRNYLMRLIKNYGIESNVSFINDFVSEEYLMEMLLQCDIYVSPYHNEAQITSGTLSYAVGAGAAVVSTPYWHAQELLDHGRGKLFDFKDSDQLADILLELLENEKEMDRIRKNAWEYGKHLRWPTIGQNYNDLFQEVCAKYEPPVDLKKLPLNLSLMPKFSLAHIKRLTDDTGIVQHAKYGIPNLKEGYCLDDNARALLMALMAYKQCNDQDALQLIPIYLSYIHYMQNKDGSFRNHLSFNRQFLDEVGSEDSFGRAIWALGYLIQFAPNNAYKQFGKELFLKSVSYFQQLTALRSIATTLIGLTYFIRLDSNDSMIQEVNILSEKLTSAFLAHAKEEWQWFEETLTYDNGILPLALFLAAEIKDDEDTLEIAKQSTRFLESITFDQDYLMPVGNKGWLSEGETTPLYDQQSVDVMAMVLLYYHAFRISKEKNYLNKCFTSYLWFLGENSLRLPLFDHETKGCCDGLKINGLNRNQGAESTLSYWISHLTILAAHEQEHEILRLL